MDDEIRILTEKDRIHDVVTRLFVFTDRKDWTGVRDCFTDEVLFDMKSLTGQDAAPTKATDIVDGWKKGLEPIQAVHHQAGNLLIDLRGADQADVFCYGIASHYLPNPTGRNTRLFVGSYDFHLVKSGGAWKIDLFRFNLKYLDGNLELEKSV